jgi:hypothetical protein
MSIFPTLFVTDESFPVDCARSYPIKNCFQIDSFWEYRVDHTLQFSFTQFKRLKIILFIRVGARDCVSFIDAHAIIFRIEWRHGYPLQYLYIFMSGVRQRTHIVRWRTAQQCANSRTDTEKPLFVMK